MFKRLSPNPFTPSSAAIGASVVKSMRGGIILPSGAGHEATYTELSSLVSHAELGPDAKLFTSGPVVTYGVPLKQTYLNLSVISSDFTGNAKNKSKEENIEDGKKLRAAAVLNMATAIRLRHPAWRLSEPKKGVKTPTLRVHGSKAPFELTANRIFDVLHSHLMREYFKQSVEGRWLAITVHQWSKRAGFNSTLSPEFGYLSTLGLEIMVANFLMGRGLIKHVDHTGGGKGGRLSSSSAKEVVGDKKEGRVDEAEKEEEEEDDGGVKAGLHISKVSATVPWIPLPTPASETMLGDLIKDFLEYYLNEFNLEQDVVGLYPKDGVDGVSVMRKVDKGWHTNNNEGSSGDTLGTAAAAGDRAGTNISMTATMAGMAHNHLCIQDPLDRSQNLGKHVSEFKFHMLRRHFHRALGNGMSFAAQEKQEE